ncbi:hypothetical protein MSMTP_1055 [Methanosarcina sp. MTP4]|nr:hypothetical protein MSMTP_1055 [Methanosarcina sp. MTP4]
MNNTNSEAVFYSLFFDFRNFMLGPHFVRGKTVRDGIPEVLFFRFLSDPGLNPFSESALFRIFKPGAGFEIWQAGKA